MLSCSRPFGSAGVNGQTKPDTPVHVMGQSEPSVQVAAHSQILNLIERTSSDAKGRSVNGRATQQTREDGRRRRERQPGRREWVTEDQRARTFLQFVRRFCGNGN